MRIGVQLNMFPRNDDEAEGQSFGGNWSDVKLEALRDYLSAYTQALKKQNFKLAYIDAFAGAGLHFREDQQTDQIPLEFDSTEDESAYRHGSPLIALDTQPKFDTFIFIDKDQQALARLRVQIEEHGHRDRTVKYLEGDANEVLEELCSKPWQNHRAVAFLDPFAMQVRWDTIKMIASTKAIDMWLLFPAMAVSRMLPRTGHVPDSWGKRLN